MREVRLRFPVAVEPGVTTAEITLSQSVLDHAPVGMLITTAASDEQVLWANAAMDGILGVDHVTLVGRRLDDVIDHEDRAELAADTDRLLAGEESLEPRELRWRTARGATRWVSARASLLRDVHGGALLVGDPPQPCVIRQLVDITDRKTAEELLNAAHAELEARNAELERSNEELTQFAYVASHDLSEPLRVISGHVELLERRYGDQLDDTAKSWIAFAVDGCSRMRTLIDDLLRYSRAGREPVDVPVDIGEVVADAVNQLQAALHEASAVVSVDSVLPTVQADAAGLRQVFANLISNAVKYRRPDRAPRVSISAGRGGSCWRFSVVDNGVGVPSHQRERVFRIFQRLHGRDVPGTGIGLAICRKVVEQHGGAITVTDAPGGGAAFTFTIHDGATICV